jgi:hypothetical protein
VTAAAPLAATSSPRTLRRGSVGPDVADLQRRLLALGFNPGNADGDFGLRTETAVRAFQRARGLTVDGVVGANTRAAIAAPVESVPTARRGEVPKAGTPLTDRGIVDALSIGHGAYFGTIPSHPRLMCCWALVALENAHGRALWCHNFGNISAFGGWTPFYVIRVQERVKRDPDVWKWIDMRFRAYQDATAGTADLWKLLAGRYGSALARMDAGDPTGAAHELARLGYFTAHADAYARTMTQLYRAWNG